MINYFSLSPLKKHKKLKRTLLKQLRLHEKAELVMSNSPPTAELASSIKAKYIKTSRLLSLPPINFRQKPSVFQEFYNLQIPKYSNRQETRSEIGVLQGLPKFFSIRRRSKSQHFTHHKTVTETEVTQVILDEIDEEISPMTILVKLKENKLKSNKLI